MSSTDAVPGVSELLEELQQLMAGHFGRIQVRGEVSQFTAARSGHWYLSVKDRDSVLSCAMFRGSNRWLGWQPEIGEEVVLTGELEIYAPRGSLSFVVRHMTRAGAGTLAEQIEAIKRRLAAEGLFDPARKRPLPAVPAMVGVATSATGAALQDVLRVAEQRFAGMPILIAPCTVQGVGAPASVVAALRALAEDGRASVVIVGRGGGSAEDLMAFNDEAVARAIAAMPMPVVSAVGHETDVTIADLVADVRAATPSHAAELVVPERAALVGMVEGLGLHLRLRMRHQSDRRRARLGACRLRTPALVIERARRRVEIAGDRMAVSAGDAVRMRSRRLLAASEALRRLSPQAVLDRGYAIVTDDQGTVLRAPDALAEGQRLRVRLAQGAVQVNVLGPSLG